MRKIKKVWQALIASAIKHEGFSLLEIKSPCVTFRPEEKEWHKKMRSLNIESTNDLMQATKNIYESDGFDTGIFYQADIPVYQPLLSEEKMLTEFEKEFEV